MSNDKLPEMLIQGIHAKIKLVRIRHTKLFTKLDEVTNQIGSSGMPLIQNLKLAVGVFDSHKSINLVVKRSILF